MNTRALIAMLAVAVSTSACRWTPYCIECTEGGIVDSSTMDGSVDAGPADASNADRPACVPSDAEELCNGLDDNCDGRVDEGFDLQTDLLNCGACGTACAQPNAELECRMGACVVTRCQEGYLDRDPMTPGCEYRCPVFPALMREECNGIDDNCDGRIDEVENLRDPPTDLCRNTPGTICAMVRPVCDTRMSNTTWYCDYPAGVEFDRNVPNGIVAEETRCDGADGDCDGVADDSFAMLGRTCSNDQRGACRDEGTVRCDPMDATRTRCDLAGGIDPVPGAPMAETCNGVDDNCDGTIDNSDPMDPARVREDMVNVRRGALDFWIYRYEASRPNASATSEGDSSSRSCSRAGVRPWTTVGYPAAAAACAAAGLRLCTGPEWQAACEGAAASAYPYGATYSATTCNGGDRDAVPGGMVDHQVSLTGALAMCRTTDGIMDLSGNVKEWTNDARDMSMPPIYVIRGGSFESPERGLTCQTDLSRARSDTAQSTLGFRCCSDRAP
ncbi:MAG: SUMF1/EgtB/PvdO family nonheme iron enzyme [Myxococcales bacterium]|nr:SUMF1/EgtB/PvdO family nonheme iron enzyme [Myxococcales bacterium]